MEELMNERHLSSTWDYEQFNEILSQENWFQLQHEFELRGASLSQSFLIWEEDSYTWLLADFDTQKAYEIKGNPNTEKPDIVSVSESSSQIEQLINLMNPHLIFPRIAQNSKGTDKGFIDLFSKLKFNLLRINLEQLKRPDLFGAGFGFDSAHQNMVIVHKKFCEIFTSTNESLIDIPRSDLQSVVSNLKKFYGYASRIIDFEISGENPRQDYNSLLGEISRFCKETKDSLRKHIAYLNSNKVEQLEDQIKITLSAAKERFNTTISDEVGKLQKIGEEIKEQQAEVLQKSEEKLKEIEQTHLKYQNQLTEKPISQYKDIFEVQAKNHGNTARNWFLGIIGLSLVFGGIFWWILKDLVPTNDDLSVILPNLLTKGFFLSLVYLLLNRFLKNYTAQKHLEVINIHRQNALETFDTFVAAAEGNRDTRDQVLLAATRAIFEANQSGYLSTKTSSSDTASPVQHFIKEVIPSKSSTDSS